MGKKRKTTSKKVEDAEDIEQDENLDEGDALDEEDLIEENDSIEDELKDAAGADEQADEIFEERSDIARQFDLEDSEDITEEREYTVPLGKAYLRPPKKRAKRAIALLRKFFIRHMKPEEGHLIILPEVNEYIWERGIEKPPRKIKIRATKNLEGKVTLYLA